MNKTSRSKYTKAVSRPLVSVIIPVFNGALYLEEAVASIQKSTYRDFEILLVDDGSTDHSKKICRRLSRRYSNIRFYDIPRNRGLGRVLNIALKKAKGELICRLNQDDRMLPTRIETQVRFLQRHPQVTAIGSSIILFDNNNRRQIIEFIKNDGDIKKLWYIVSPFSDPSVMYRKSTALDVRGYDQNFWPADDTQLWYRMGLKGKLANLKTPLTEVRWHDKAASVVFFRKLAIKTYEMHEWTHEFIAPAPWYVRLYWLVQLITGYTLSPQFNWAVYRKIKKFIAFYETWKNRLEKMHARDTVAKVTIHPKKLNFSGV